MTYFISIVRSFENARGIALRTQKGQETQSLPTGAHTLMVRQRSKQLAQDSAASVIKDARSVGTTGQPPDPAWGQLRGFLEEVRPKIRRPGGRGSLPARQGKDLGESLTLFSTLHSSPSCDLSFLL